MWCGGDHLRFLINKNTYWNNPIMFSWYQMRWKRTELADDTEQNNEVWYNITPHGIQSKAVEECQFFFVLESKKNDKKNVNKTTDANLNVEMCWCGKRTHNLTSWNVKKHLVKLKVTWKCGLYEQVPFIYMLKLYALLINMGKMKLPFTDSDLLYRGAF